MNSFNLDKVTMPRRMGGLDVRIAKEANTSLLGKLVWDLQHNTNKLWMQVISHKYVNGGCFLDGKKSTGSHVWNSISKARSVLRYGFQTRVGNGRSSFWYDSWSPLGPLCTKVDYINIQDTDMLVRDVFRDGSWCMENLATIIPLQVKNSIESIHFHLNEVVPYSFIWQENVNGNYTAKTGFSWLYKKRVDVSSLVSWTWIWHMKGSEKLKFFVWLVTHNSIPTNSLLHHRNMSTNRRCQQCLIEDETIIYCIRDCPLSRSVWYAFGFRNAEFSQDLHHINWIKDGLSRENGALFMACIWWCWRARNSL